ncbi:hypothetical protein J2T19_000151 [Paenibacillus tundrae]|uniref:Sigma-70 family RNA polymerase sigma factor n=1 Tax=Paenibacillus tundrae TaxID=528187 RepID=A0ABT9W636_9BACL|nr:hypothetical protein [Paenibacillus tundrae]
MLNKQQLNNLATKAKNGDSDAMWEVKYHFQKMIHQMSEYNRNRLNQADFEDECFKIIEETVMRFEAEKGDLPQLVVNFIKRRLGRTTKRYSTKTKADEYVTVSMVHNENTDGYMEFEIQDDLAIVDKDLMYNERITGLAAGDSKKLAILKAWSEPGHSVTATAQELALLFGGKAESHRKSITRFRSDCQKALACAI